MNVFMLNARMANIARTGCQSLTFRQSVIISVPISYPFSLYEELEYDYWNSVSYDVFPLVSL